MEMSNPHIKRREYEVVAGTDSYSTRHAGDVPSVPGDKGITQPAALEGHDADIYCVVGWRRRPREPAGLEAVEDMEQCLHRRRHLLRNVKPPPTPFSAVFRLETN